MILVLSLIFLGIIAMEAPRLLREQKWRDLAAFGGVLLVAMVMTFAAALDIKIPNPTRGIEAIFKPAAEFLEKLLS
ncbi:MAG: hypothetical protein ACOY4Q_11430 [Bacillota bacterium]